MSKFTINEELLGEIESLASVLKNNVAGMFGGNRQSKSFGSSCEFADYRDYLPGDDINRIDWNAYARFDKLYEKLYYDERQMHTRIYIDASRSMCHGSDEKASQALRIAACLAYLSVCEMEKVSIYAIHGSEIEEVISGMVGKESYITYINKLNDIEFLGDSHISEAIIPSNVGRGDGFSVIISDFLTDENYESAIDHLVSKKKDVICIQVLSAEEINPQMRGKMHLFDSEDATKTYRKKIDNDIVKAYKSALRFVIERIKNYCEARGAYYLLAPGNATIYDIFFTKMVDMGVLK
ncbi:MAG: DUF58 domain-containing protein [Ruminococcaceae bacterium]|nr:DUF58 domain-containing protein [Oscillospiraceae bacterium]